MPLKTVTVSAGRTLNLGNYESMRFDSGATWELEDGEDEALVLRGLWQMVKANLRKQTLPYLDEQAARVEQILLGFPANIREQLLADMQQRVTVLSGGKEG